MALLYRQRRLHVSRLLLLLRPLKSLRLAPQALQLTQLLLHIIITIPLLSLRLAPQALQLTQLLLGNIISIIITPLLVRAPARASPKDNALQLACWRRGQLRSSSHQAAQVLGCITRQVDIQGLAAAAA